MIDEFFEFITLIFLTRLAINLIFTNDLSLNRFLCLINYKLNF